MNVVSKQELDQIRKRFFQLQGKQPYHLTYEDIAWLRITLGKLLSEIELRNKEQAKKDASSS